MESEHPKPQSFATSEFKPQELPITPTNINTAEWTPNGIIYTDDTGKQIELTVTPLVQPSSIITSPTIASLQSSLAALQDTVAALTATTDTRFNKVAQIIAPPRAV